MAEDFDLRDILLEAEADVREVLREVQQELMTPFLTDSIAQQWMSLPEAMKEKFMNEKPDEYAALMDLLKGD
jgi:hypothetical protein